MKAWSELAKDVKRWYDETKPDFIGEDEMTQLAFFLEHADDLETEEHELDEYIDPTERGGVCGKHYADEDMYFKSGGEE